MGRKNTIHTVFGKLEESSWLNAAKQWKEDRAWLDYSFDIALDILEHLQEDGLSQKDFAAMMAVSPQAVNKWLKGKENFTLETISRMEAVLGIRLIRTGSSDPIADNVAGVAFNCSSFSRTETPINPTLNKQAAPEVIEAGFLKTAKVVEMKFDYQDYTKAAGL